MDVDVPCPQHDNSNDLEFLKKQGDLSKNGHRTFFLPS